MTLEQEVLFMIRQRCAFYLNQLEYQVQGRMVKVNGYVYAKVPEWALRQTIDRIDDALKDSEQDVQG